MCELGDDATWDEAVDFGKDLLDDIAVLRERVEDGDLPDGANDFADEVEPKVEGIVEWMETECHVTEKQVAALRGIRGGVNRWLGRD